jgi:hypothetical protein
MSCRLAGKLLALGNDSLKCLARLGGFLYELLQAGG